MWGSGPASLSSLPAPGPEHLIRPLFRASPIWLSTLTSSLSPSEMALICISELLKFSITWQFK